MIWLRKTLLLATAVVSVGLVSSARAADVEPFLPNDSEVVASVNVTQLLNSPLGKKYFRGAIEQGLKDNPQAGEILKFAELDPLKDVSRVTLAMWGKDNVIVIATGKFNTTKIADLAAKAAADQPDKLKIHKSDGSTIYEMTDENKKPTFAAFATDSTLLISSDKDTLKDVASKSSTKVGTLKNGLAILVAKADGKQTLWLASLPTIANALPLPANNPQQKQAVDGLEAISGSLHIVENGRLTLALTSKNAASAQALNKQVVDAVNLGKLFLPAAVKDTPQLAPLLDVINTIRTLVKGKTVTITVDVSARQIEQAIKSVQKDK